MAIQSFRDSETESIWKREFVKRFSAIAKQALVRPELLNAAQSLDDLRSLRGNRLEALLGDRDGQFSVRINDQYRICFLWRKEHAYEVEITDYH